MEKQQINKLAAMKIVETLVVSLKIEHQFGDGNQCSKPWQLQQQQQFVYESNNQLWQK